MECFFSFIKGIVIGIGAILPGISSGVLCVVFGFYDKLVNSIIYFHKNWKQHILFLLPVISGAGVGVVLFSHILKLLFATYPVPTNFTFIGLILGSIPILLKKANERGSVLHHVFFFFLSFLLSIGLILIENHISSYRNDNISFFYLILSGFLMSAGIVIPGVSSTVILMLCGVYPIYLNALSVLDFSILIPMGLGLLVGSFIFLKLIQYCFEKYPSQTYYSIIGFVAGSIFILYKPLSFNIESLFAFFSLLLGLIAGRKIG